MSIEVLLKTDKNKKLTWPKGAPVPNVGDVILLHNKSEVAVTGRTFEIAKDKLVRITISVDLPS